ncbi:MAG TPA: DUF2752 domain-containing protein [Chthoniobacterales bacterium]|jgi:hypothetical protein
MRIALDQNRLRVSDIALRLGLLAVVALFALVLRNVDPAASPLHPSCGALTGLPCIFCGTTRALHHLLNGNFARALYFNWLAFPVALLGVAMCARGAAEIILHRKVLIPLPNVKLSGRSVAAAGACIVALWIFQVSLAVGMHKHELLNPRGVLYQALVR